MTRPPPAVIGHLSSRGANDWDPPAGRADGQAMNSADRPNAQVAADNPVADLLVLAQATVGLVAGTTALLAILGVA